MSLERFHVYFKKDMSPKGCFFCPQFLLISFNFFQLEICQRVFRSIFQQLKLEKAML
jgi:hypothetical protein